MTLTFAGCLSTLCFAVTHLRTVDLLWTCNDDPALAEWKRKLNAPFDARADDDALAEIARVLPRRRLPDGLSVGLDLEGDETAICPLFRWSHWDGEGEVECMACW